MYCVSALPVEVVLVDAGLDAAPEALALRNVEGVAEEDSRQCIGGGDGDILVMEELGEALEPLDGLGALLRGHAAIMLLGELLPFEKS